MKLSTVRSFPDPRRRAAAAGSAASIGIYSRYPPRKSLISVSGMRPASVEFSLVTCQESDGLRHASAVSRDSQQNRLTMAVPAPTHKNTTGCERPLTTNDKSGNNQPPTDRPVSLVASHHSQPTITATTIDSLTRFHIVGCELPLTTNDIDTQNSRRTRLLRPYCESPLTTNDKDTNNQPTDSIPHHRLRTTTHNETP